MARPSGITSAFTIREYRDSDQAQVVDLIRELQAHEAPMHRWGKSPEDIGPWYITGLMKRMARQAGYLFVAEQAGMLFGYAAVLTCCEEDGADDDIAYTYALVADLAVTRDARRQGIGQALLSACEQVARGKGCTVMRIGVLAGNEMAIGAYGKFGFEPYLHTMEKILE